MDCHHLKLFIEMFLVVVFLIEEKNGSIVADTRTIRNDQYSRKIHNKNYKDLKFPLRQTSKIIPIIHYENEINPNGSYRYQFQTKNRINRKEEGRFKNTSFEVEGVFSYSPPDGKLVTLNYIANENGYHPSGNHLPTPPPIYEALLQAIRLHELASGRGIEKPPQPILFSSEGKYIQGSYVY